MFSAPFGTAHIYLALLCKKTDQTFWKENSLTYSTGKTRIRKFHLCSVYKYSKKGKASYDVFEEIYFNNGIFLVVCAIGPFATPSLAMSKNNVVKVYKQTFERNLKSKK